MPSISGAFIVSIIVSALSIGLVEAAPPTYEIGSIPDLVVYRGAKSVIRVTAPDCPLATIGFTFSQPITGGFDIDPSRQEILFRLAPYDRGRYGGTVTASCSSRSWSQKILVTTMPAPEFAVVSHLRTAPPATNASYYTLEEHTIPGKKLFNYALTSTVEINIAGHHIVLEPSDLTPFWKNLHARPDLEDVRIYAEMLVVNERIELPQTNVFIQARYLCFGPNGSIVTTPKALIGAEPRADGNPGLPAGSITLLIGALNAPPCPQAAGTGSKLDLTGGQGQKAGDGERGENRKEITVLTQEQIGWCERYKMPRNDITYIRPSNCGGRPVGPFGNPNIPENGGHAQSPGKPGIGGAGGQLVSTLDLSSMYKVGGGRSGEVGAAAEGGNPSNATVSHFTIVDQIPGIWHKMTEYKATKGESKQSVKADAEFGPAGQFTLKKDPTGIAWLSPAALQMTVLYLRDMYLHGHIEDVEQRAMEYRALLTDVGPSFTAARLDLELILNRIAAGLDWFGHPAGWVPHLSLLSYYDIFQKELETAVPTIYLSQWLETQWRKEDQRAAAVELAGEDARRNAAENGAKLQQAFKDVSELRTTASEIESDIQQVQKQLKELESRLTKEAENIVDARQSGKSLRSAFRTLGTIAMAIPLGQPAVGVAGASLISLSQIDERDPVKAGQAGLAAYQAFRNISADQIGDDFRKRIQVLDPSGKTSIPEYVAEAEKVSKEVAELAKKFREAVAPRQVPRSEIDAELERLKAENVEFQKVTDALTQLTAKKHAFVARLSVANTNIIELNAQIAQAIVTADSAAKESGQLARLRNMVFRTHIKKMARDVLDRLIAYHYEMVKAYEYHTADQYPGTLQLDSFIRNIRELTERNSDQPNFLKLPSKDSGINIALENELRSVARKIFDKAAEGQLQGLISSSHITLTTEQRDRLNEEGQLNINPFKLKELLPDKEGHRISELKIRFDITPEKNATAHTVYLWVDHSGESIIRRDGKQFLFRHRDTPGFFNIWGASRRVGEDREENLPGDKTERTLLRRLAGSSDDDATKDQVADFRPSAWADLQLRRTFLKDGGSGIKITAVTLELTTSLLRVPDGEMMMDIIAPAGVIINLTTETGETLVDKGGRADGTSHFTRFFQKGQRILLAAPQTAGRRTFRRWVFMSCPANSTESRCSNTSLPFQLNDNTRIEALYE